MKFSKHHEREIHGQGQLESEVRPLSHNDIFNRAKTSNRGLGLLFISAHNAAFTSNISFSSHAITTTCLSLCVALPQLPRVLRSLFFFLLRTSGPEIMTHSCGFSLLWFSLLVPEAESRWMLEMEKAFGDFLCTDSPKLSNYFSGPSFILRTMAPGFCQRTHLWLLLGPSRLLLSDTVKTQLCFSF